MAKLVLLHIRIALNNAVKADKVPGVGFNISIDNIPVVKDTLFDNQANNGTLDYKETILTPNKPHKLVVSNNCGIHKTEYEFTLSEEKYMDVVFNYHANEKDENQGFSVELLDTPTEFV